MSSDLLKTLKQMVLDAAQGEMGCPDNYGLEPAMPDFGCMRIARAYCQGCVEAAIKRAEREERLGLKLHVKNQTSHTMQFCCGEKEYVLQPDEETTIEVKDEDCMYLDQAAIEQAEEGEDGE